MVFDETTKRNRLGTLPVMRSTKVRPTVEFEWPHSRDAGRTEFGDDNMSGSRRDYLVRQAFLRSYKFTVEESFGEKVKRSLIELNEMAKRVFQELRSEIISAQRLGLRRVVRFRLSKSYLVQAAQCFTLKQKEEE